MTFGGESLSVDWANWIGPGEVPDDFYWGWDLMYRLDEYSLDLAAGHSIIAGFYNNADYWLGEEVVASLVLVFRESSNGTLRLSIGPDYDWELDDPGVADTSLGTHTIVGATELVLPLTNFDLEGFAGWDFEYAVHIEGISGTLEIQQAKLRLWPPGGPAGAWAPAPGYSFELSPSVWVGRIGDVAGGLTVIGHSVTDIEDAFDSAVAEFATASRVLHIPFHSSSITSVQGRVRRDIQDGQYFIDNQVQLDLAYMHVSVSATRLVDYVVGVPDAGRHPDEVRGEGAVISVGGGLLYAGFAGWNRGLVARITAGATSIGPDGRRIYPSTVPSVIAVNAAERLPTHTRPELAGGAWANHPHITGGLDKVPAGGREFVFERHGDVFDPDSWDWSEQYHDLELPNAPGVELWIAPYSWYERRLENYYLSGSNDRVENWFSAAQLYVERPSDLRANMYVPPHLYWKPDLPWQDPVDDFDDDAASPGYLISPNAHLDGEFIDVAVRFSGS